MNEVSPLLFSFNFHIIFPTSSTAEANRVSWSEGTPESPAGAGLVGAIHASPGVTSCEGTFEETPSSSSLIL